MDMGIGKKKNMLTDDIINRLLRAVYACIFQSRIGIESFAVCSCMCMAD